MSPQIASLSRRGFLGAGLVLGSTGFMARGAFAEQLARTPRLTEGPFYPDKLPLDTDNDLLIVNDSITPAVGEITHLSGRIRSMTGEPIRNALVEIWQVDSKAVYIHTADSGRKQRDKNFQGFGRFLTGSTGEYYFRTIKPVPYPGRCPHIHVAVKKDGKRLLTTQLFINGEPRNKSDGIFRSVGGETERQLVLVDFKPMKESKIGELTAQFDIVVGLTPEEPERRR